MSTTDEETENHWPGYVDALTTMTMMLIFVMMILAVAIFSMSENVSRALVEKIGTAMGIAEPPATGTLEGYTKDIISELEKRAALLKSSEVAVARTTDNTQSPTPPPDAILAPPPGTGRIIESRAAPLENPPDGAVDAHRTDALLTLIFNARATTLDEKSRDEMRRFASESSQFDKARRFDLKAYASMDQGALSDSRRIAYYRGMAVRAQLIALGVPPSQISLKVLDRGGPDQANRLQVFAQNGTAAAPGLPEIAR